MNGVLGLPALARQDAVIGIGVTQRFGARWRRSSNPDGSNPQPFDMTGYEGKLVIVSNEGESWLDVPAHFENSSGLVSVSIAPNDTSGPQWSNRSIGVWGIVVTSPGGDVTVVVSGTMRITQGVM